MSKGAGVILKSSLVFSGWKLPIVQLIELDDRFLFDVEVKVKLGHLDSEKLLQDILSDFPVESILQRPGLLQAVLDVVGSIVPGQRDLSLGLMNPLSAIEWLGNFFRKCISSFETILEGSKCSSLPASLQEYSSCQDNLSSQLAIAMFTMRHPLVGGGGAESLADASSMPFTADDATQIPSLGGLAFAIAAACLPLLRAKDGLTSSAVLSVIRIVTPFILEPTVQIQSSQLCPSSSNNDGREFALLISSKRMQHLLNRLDQLLHCFNDVKPPTASVYLVCASGSTDSHDQSSATADASFNLSFIAIVNAVINQCPEPWISSPASLDSGLRTAVADRLVGAAVVGEVGPSPSPSPSLSLSLGSKTIALLRSVCIAAKSSEALSSPLAASTHTESILRKLDVNFDVNVSRSLQLHADWQRVLTHLTPSNCSDASHQSFDGLLNATMSSVALLDASHTAGSIDAEQCQSFCSTIPLLMIGCFREPGTRSSRAIDTCLQLIQTVLSMGSGSLSNTVIGGLLSLVASSATVVEKVHDCLSVFPDDRRAEFSPGLVKGCQLSAEQKLLLSGWFKHHLSLGSGSSSVDQMASSIIAGQVDNVLQALCSPSLIHSLLQCCIAGGFRGDYNESELDMPSSQTSPERDWESHCSKVLVFALLDEIASFAIIRNIVSPSTIQDWCSILGTLKIIEWSNCFSTPATKSLISNCFALEQFIQKIEDCSASSSDRRTHSFYYKTLIFGTFHLCESIRARCGSRLRREVLGLNARTDRAAVFPMDADPLASLTYVALHEHPVESVEGSYSSDSSATIASPARGKYEEHLAVVSDLQALKSTKLSTFTHADVRKLVIIAFNSKSDHLVRAAAVSQAVEMLKDDYLLATSGPSWLVSVVHDCCNALQGIVWDASVLSLPEAQYFRNVALLLRTLVLRHPDARNAFSYVSVPPSDSTAGAEYTPEVLKPKWIIDGIILDREAAASNSSDATPAAVNIRPVLAAYFANVVSTNNCSPKLLSTFLEIKSLCAQVLFAISCDASSWSSAPTHYRGSSSGPLSTIYPLTFRTSEAKCQLDASDHKPLIGLRSLIIPRFLKTASVFVSHAASGSLDAPQGAPLAGVRRSLSVQEMRTTFRFGDLQLNKCGSTCDAPAPPSPPAELLSDVWRALEEKVEESHLDLLARALVSTISQAKTHSSFRSALDLIHSFCASLQSSAFSERLIRNGIIAGLSRILKTAPTTEKDYLVLAAVLDIINMCLEDLSAARCGTQTAMASKLSEFLTLVFDAISNPLLPILKASFKGNFDTSAVHSAKGMGCSPPAAPSGLASLSTHRVQSSLLRCLTLICLVARSGSSGLLDELDAHPIAITLVGILTSENRPPAIRLAAGTALEHLVTSFNVVDVLCQNSKLVDVRGQYTLCHRGDEGDTADCPARDLIRSVRLLRSPDSFHGTASLSASLRVLYVTLQVVSPNSSLFESFAGSILQDWKWLLRLCYDRRNTIKILVLEIIARVVKSEMGISALIQASSSPASVIPQEEDDSNVTLSIFDHLHHILLDSSECPAARVAALGVLVNRLRHCFTGKPATVDLVVSSLSADETVNGSAVEKLTSWCASEASRILSNIAELLCTTASSNFSVSTAFSLHESVSQSIALIQLFSAGAMKSRSSTHTLGENVSLKDAFIASLSSNQLLPALVNLLDKSISFQLTTSLLTRVSIGVSIANESTVVPVEPPSSVPSCRFDVGWGTCATRALRAMDVSVFQTQGLVCHAVGLIGFRDKDTLKQCVKHTMLLQGLVASLSSPGEGFFYQHSQIDTNTFSCMHLNLLSSLVQLDSEVPSCDPTDGRGKEFELNLIPDGNAIVPLHVLKAIVTHLERCLQQLTALRQAHVCHTSVLSSVIGLGTCCLRLLSLIFNHPAWSSSLGFGDGLECCPVGSLASRALESLFSLRRFLHSELLEASAMLALPEEQRKFVEDHRVVFQTRIDVMLSLLTSHSAAARTLAVGGPVVAPNAASPTKHAICGKTIVRNCVHQIRDIVNIIINDSMTPKAATSASPRGPINSPITTKKSASKTNVAEKWRRHVRSYEVSEEATGRHHSHLQAPRLSPAAGLREANKKVKPFILLSDNQRKILWSNLVILNGLLMNCQSTQSIALELGLHESLSVLFSACGGWANTTALLATQSYFSSTRREALAKRDSPSSWLPSDGQLAAATLGVCSSFISQSSINKAAVAKTGSSKLNLIPAAFALVDPLAVGGASASAAQGNTLNQLLAISMSKSVVGSARWTCLNLLASLLLCENSASAMQKNSIGNTLSRALQKGLYTSPTGTIAGASSLDCLNISPTALFFMITAWSACLATASSELGGATALMDRRRSGGSVVHISVAGHVAGSTIDPSRNRSYISGGSDSRSQARRAVNAELEAPQIPIPELLSSLHDKHAMHFAVAAAIARCIGCLAVGSSIGFDYSDLSSPLATDSSPGHRRLIANAMSHSCLQILAYCMPPDCSVAHIRSRSPGANVVASIAQVSLWTLFHASEHARSVWRQSFPDTSFTLSRPSDLSSPLPAGTGSGRPGTGRPGTGRPVADRAHSAVRNRQRLVGPRSSLPVDEDDSSGDGDEDTFGISERSCYDDEESEGCDDSAVTEEAASSSSSLFIEKVANRAQLALQEFFL